MKLVLVLLCAGFVHFTFASNRLRIFSANETKYKWTNTLNKCKNTSGSLVTLYDDEDADFTEKFVESVIQTDDNHVWLGLRRNRSITWSDNNTVIFKNFTVDVTNGEQGCIAIVNETWTNFSCSDQKPFMCYRGTNYTLIENENLTWCQALQYCRNHFSDLVSISNEDQNKAVIEKGNSTTFWIGLMFDEWKWEDNGCSSYGKWFEDKNQEKNCIDFYYGALSKVQCKDQSKYLFCSRGYVRIKVIEQNKTWEEALNYCEANHSRLLWIRDEQDQEAVTQWLNMTDADGPFWIALRQSRVFGFWIWSNRTVTYHNWRNGSAPEMPFSQHCGVIETDDFKWRDENCLSERYFLCEEDIIYM